jgi:hypothetical protein
MAVTRSRLDGKLRSDPWFASRFYRALGILLSSRLRNTVAELAYGSQELSLDADDVDELAPELLENLSLAAARFESLVARLPRPSIP